MAGFPSRAKKLGRAELYDYALRLLGMRALTERELRQRLSRRALEAADVDAAVERLVEIGYLDDARAAESHAHSRREFSALGPIRVRNELRRRGVEAETVERTVEAAYREVDEEALIRKHIERKLGADPAAKLADPKQVDRLYRALRRAGFSSGKIVTALGKAAADVERLEGVEDDEAEISTED